MEFSKVFVFISFLALFAGGVIAQGDAAAAAGETAVQTQEPTQELVPETEPAAPVAASQVEESAAAAAPEATTQTPTVTNKATTTDTENEAKKTDNGSGFGKWWNRLKCLVFGFGPFRLGCPDKKEKDGSSGGGRVHGMIAIIEESGESGQLDDEQMVASLEKEVVEEEEEEQQQQQQSEESDGDNENAPAGDVQINGQLNETSTNEEGKTQTNIAQLDAEGH
uniref:Secreted protein n=1 Tax=Globodera pallida TaxID=36090 RepID=A0A183C4L2_GLOPA